VDKDNDGFLYRVGMEISSDSKLECFISCIVKSTPIHATMVLKKSKKHVP
jgi:hypothetical protein